MSFTAAHSLIDAPYPFAELERRATAMRAMGKRFIDLSIGDPDASPPEYVVEAARRALGDPASHRYPSSRGQSEVRESVARWFKVRFGVELDPQTQVCILIGAKEGLAQLARAVVNPDDVVAVPDPSYPVYRRAGCRLVRGSLRRIEMTANEGYLPNLNATQGARLFYVNYPNNPTGAAATPEFLRQLGQLADSNPKLTVAYDMAYSETAFEAPTRSLLEFTDNAVEFHSLSKMANCTGYRVGFAAGDAARIDALVKIKEESDSGAPLPFQRALQAMLDRYEGKYPPPEVAAVNRVYAERRKIIEAALIANGFEVFPAAATFYVWFKVGGDENAFASRALEAGLLLTPGSGFGSAGRGWMRASLTASDEDIEAAAETLVGLG